MNAIFAVNSIGGFGHNNSLPWPKSPVDLKRFKTITTGHTVVMGSGTWLSDMPKPLPNRRNIVISKSLIDSRCDVYASVEDMMMNVSEKESVFVIGGAKLLCTMLPYINRVYLTKFNSVEQCDVTLDVKQYLKDFELISGELSAGHRFEIWERLV